LVVKGPAWTWTRLLITGKGGKNKKEKSGISLTTGDVKEIGGQEKVERSLTVRLISGKGKWKRANRIVVNNWFRGKGGQKMTDVI